MKKKIFYLLTFLFILFFSVIFYCSCIGFSPDLCPPLKNFVSKLEKGIQKKIYFRRVKTNFLNQVQLVDFSLAYTPGVNRNGSHPASVPPFLLEKINLKVNFHLFKLLRDLKNPAKSITRISLEKGKILLTNRYLSKDSAFRWENIFFLPKIAIRDISLEIEDMNNRFPRVALEKIYGSCFFEGGKWSVQISGGNQRENKWKLKGCLFAEEEITLEMEGENFDLAFWGKYFPLGKYKPRSGLVSFIFDLKSSPGTTKQLDYQGKIYLEKGEIPSPYPGLNLTNLSGEIIFAKEKSEPLKCSLEDFKGNLGSSLVYLKGEINDPLGAGSSLNLSSSFDSPWAKINGEFYFSSLTEKNKLAGEGKIEIKSLSLLRKFGGPDLDNFKASFRYLNNKLTLKGETLEKIHRLDLSAIFRGQEIEIEKFIWDNFSFQGQISEWTREPLLKGRLRGRKIVFQGKPYSLNTGLTWSGTCFNLTNFSFFTLREKIFVSSFSISGREFFSSNWRINTYRLDEVKGKISYTGQIFTLSAVVNNFAHLESEVNFSSSPETVEGKLSVEKIDWKEVEKIFLLGKEIKKSDLEGFTLKTLKGKFSSGLSFSGTLSQPKIEGNLSFEEGVFQGAKFSLSGEYFYDSPSGFVLNVSALLEEPFKGEVKGKIQLANLFQPEIRGHFSSEKISWEKTDLKNLKFELCSRQDRLEIVSFQSKIAEAEIRLSSSSYLEGNKFFLFAELRNFNLFGPNIFGKLTLSGERKNLLLPTTDITVLADNLWINQYNLVKNKFFLRYQNKILTFFPIEKEKIQLSGEIDFSGYPKIDFKDLTLQEGEEKILFVRGTVDTKDMQFSMEGRRFPISSLIGLNNWKFPSQGVADFNLLLSGNLDLPKIKGNFNLQECEIYNLHFDTFTVIFSLKENIFTLENLTIYTENKYFLTGSGEFPLSGKSSKARKRIFDLSFNLKEGNLSLFDDLSNGKMKAKGKIDGKLKIKGEIGSPVMQGKIVLSGGEIEMKNVFKKISDLNAEIELAERTVFLRSAEAKIGQGKIQMGGKIELLISSEGKEMLSLKVNKYDLFIKTVNDKGVNVSIEDLVIPQSTIFKRLVRLPSQGEAKINLYLVNGSVPHHPEELKDGKEKPTLGGTIELANTHFTYPSSEKGTSEWGDFFHLFLCELEMKMVNNVWYENELANANISGYLKLSGPGENLNVDGRIESERGNLSYLNRNFEVKKMVFEVINGICYLEGSAETKALVSDPQTRQIVSDTIVMSLERNKLGEIQPKFSSKSFPNLSTERVLKSLFAQVDTNALSPEEQQTFFRQEVLRWFDTSLATPLIQNIVRYSGLVDAVRLTREIEEPATPGTEQTLATAEPIWRDLAKGSKVTFEKYINPYLLLGYSVKLDTLLDRLNLKHELEVAYRFRWKGDVFLRAIYGLERTTPGSMGPERKIYLEPSWRFGGEEEE